VSLGTAVSVSGVPERESGIPLKDGRQLAWSEWGPETGRVVVLLHGAPGSSHYCPDVATTQELGVRLVAADRPGYGRSTARPGRTLLDWADDLVELLDHLEVAAVPVVGWSSGVPFAIASAVGRPDRIAALALVAGDGPLDDVPGVRDALPPERAERIAALRADPVAGRVAARERAAFYAERPESIMGAIEPPGGGSTDSDDPDVVLRRIPEARAALLEMFRHGALHGADGWVDDSIAIQLPWRFSLGSVACPTTVWYGAKDRLAERRDSEYLARAIPGAELVIEPDDGHSLPVHHWREILERVLGT